MPSGPIVEFLSSAPRIVAAGHDGFSPYNGFPFDEIYVMARGGQDRDLHTVEIFSAYRQHHLVANGHGVSRSIIVHQSGFLWHDRSWEVPQPYNANWLSSLGFTVSDPRKLEVFLRPIFTPLPGLASDQVNFAEFLVSQEWRDIRDFHARGREWMKAHLKPSTIKRAATRFERDEVLVSRLKNSRGSACQVCGFRLVKFDGTDYCEAHHLEWLSQGGLDVASNMLILCPNCHKTFHCGCVEILNHTPLELTVKINGRIHACALAT